MENLTKDYYFANLLKLIRKKTGLTQEEFAKRIGRNRKWLAYKEINSRKMYMDDFMSIIKTFKFDIIFRYDGNRRIKINDFEPKDFLRILRELTGKNQTQFATLINKSNFWQNLNENGKTRYYANDLFDLASKNGFEIELCYKGDIYEN